MKYEKCLTCKQLGDTCDGANFLSMETAELAEWCNARRKTIPGLTYDKIAAETGVSKSAVYGFLTGAHTDYRLETIRPILKICVGGNWDNNPCGNVDTSEKAAYENRIQYLETRLAGREEKVQHYADLNAELHHNMAHLEEGEQKKIMFLMEQLELAQKVSNAMRKTIVALSIALAVLLLLIIAGLIIDRTNPDAGFFWLRSFFEIGNHSVAQKISI